MSDPNSRSTRLGLRAMRADALHRLLASPRGTAALTLGDVGGLPDLAGWNRNVLDAAVADLVADGRLADDECGRLVVRKATL